MSHVVTIDTEIHDLDCLGTAAEQLGMELVRGQTSFRWYGSYVGDSPLPEGFAQEDLGHCEHAIRIPGNKTAYEVGVARRRDGRSGWTLLYDNWLGGRGLHAVAGPGCSKLIQRYAGAVVAKTMGSHFHLTQEEQKDGSLRITLSR